MLGAFVGVSSALAARQTQPVALGSDYPGRGRDNEAAQSGAPLTFQARTAGGGSRDVGDYRWAPTKAHLPLEVIAPMPLAVDARRPAREPRPRRSRRGHARPHAGLPGCGWRRPVCLE